MDRLIKFMRPMHRFMAGFTLSISANGYIGDEQTHALGMPLMSLMRPFAVLLFFFATLMQPVAAQPAEPGAMLREGLWSGDMGTFNTPPALANLAPVAWPKDGWYKLTIGPKLIASQRIVAVRREAPAFLRSILHELQTPPTEPREEAIVNAACNSEGPKQLYLRVPGTRLQEGSLPLYVFKNGSSTLQPQLDVRYALKWGGQPFAFTVKDGLRSKNGTAYGSGAHYTIEYDGHSHEYSLTGYGWASKIDAITDIDGDGKPDFKISVDNSAGKIESILLSTKAKPGKLPATASLSLNGCE
jgi:hypothetical protein